MIGSEAFDALFKTARDDASPYPDGTRGGEEFGDDSTDTDQQSVAPKDVKQMFNDAMDDVPIAYPDAKGVTAYGLIVSMAGDFIGDVNPISVGDTGVAGTKELDTVKHQTIQRMFPIELGAEEGPTVAGVRNEVLAKYCPDGSTDAQRLAMCETYNKAWKHVVDRCGRAYPPRGGLGSLSHSSHSSRRIPPRRFKDKWFPAFQKCKTDFGVDTEEVKEIFDNELAAVTKTKSKYAGIDAISSFHEMQPDEIADKLDQYNKVVDATDGDSVWSAVLGSTFGFLPKIGGKVNYGINLKHHAGKLLKVNFDHFSREAHAAYVAGHYLALQKANEAHDKYLKAREQVDSELVENNQITFKVTEDGPYNNFNNGRLDEFKQDLAKTIWPNVADKDLPDGLKGGRGRD